MSIVGRLPEMEEPLRAMLEESAAVARALGIELPVSIDRRLEAGIAVADRAADRRDGRLSSPSGGATCQPWRGRTAQLVACRPLAQPANINDH